MKQYTPERGCLSHKNSRFHTRISSCGCYIYFSSDFGEKPSNSVLFFDYQLNRNIILGLASMEEYPSEKTVFKKVHSVFYFELDERGELLKEVDFTKFVRHESGVLFTYLLKHDIC